MGLRYFSKDKSNKSTCGGVLRDSTGELIGVSISNLGGCSVLVVKLLTSCCCRSHPSFSIIKAIHAIHNSTGNVVWNHFLREANQTADRLASYSLHFKIKYKWFYKIVILNIFLRLPLINV